jgi:hypothetical protein
MRILYRYSTKLKNTYLEGLNDLVLSVPGHGLGIDHGRLDAVLHAGGKSDIRRKK